MQNVTIAALGDQLAYEYNCSAVIIIHVCDESGYPWVACKTLQEEGAIVSSTRRDDRQYKYCNRCFYADYGEES